MSEYDVDPTTFDEIVAFNPAPVTVKTLDLSQAGAMQFREVGNGFVMYGQNLDDSKNVEAYMSIAIDSDGVDQDRRFPAKTGRGFRGPFFMLSCSWPAQPGVTAKLLIFKSSVLPWQGGQEAT